MTCREAEQPGEGGLVRDACGQHGHGYFAGTCQVASHDPVDDAPGNQQGDEPSRPRGAGVCHISLKAEMRPWLLFMYALAPSSGVIYSASRGLALNY